MWRPGPFRVLYVTVVVVRLSAGQQPCSNDCEVTDWPEETPHGNPKRQVLPVRGTRLRRLRRPFHRPRLRGPLRQVKPRHPGRQPVKPILLTFVEHALNVLIALFVFMILLSAL